MKYIESRPGLNINKDMIISVESIDMMSCKITTANREYDCIYPSWRILMQLEEPTIQEQIAMQPQSPTQSRTDRTNLWGAQHWAG